MMSLISFRFLPITLLLVLAGGVASLRALDKQFGLSSDRSFSWFITVRLVRILKTLVGFGYARMIKPSEVYVPLSIIVTSNVEWSGLPGWALTFLTD